MPPLREDWHTELAARPCSFDQVFHIVFGNEVVGDEGGSVGDFTFIICYAEPNPVHLEGIRCIHEWDAIDIAVEEVTVLLAGPLCARELLLDCHLDHGLYCVACVSQQRDPPGGLNRLPTLRIHRAAATASQSCFSCPSCGVMNAGSRGVTCGMSGPTTAP
jgi:hypothetical protein